MLQFAVGSIEVAFVVRSKEVVIAVRCSEVVVCYVGCSFCLLTKETIKVEGGYFKK